MAFATYNSIVVQIYEIFGEAITSQPALCEDGRAHTNILTGSPHAFEHEESENNVVAGCAIALCYMAHQFGKM